MSNKVTFALTMKRPSDNVAAVATFEADVIWNAFDPAHSDLMADFHGGMLLSLEMHGEKWGSYKYTPTPLSPLELNSDVVVQFCELFNKALQALQALRADLPK